MKKEDIMILAKEVFEISCDMQAKPKKAIKQIANAIRCALADTDSTEATETAPTTANNGGIAINAGSNASVKVYVEAPKKAPEKTPEAPKKAPEKTPEAPKKAPEKNPEAPEKIMEEMENGKEVNKSLVDIIPDGKVNFALSCGQRNKKLLCGWAADDGKSGIFEIYVPKSLSKNAKHLKYWLALKQFKEKTGIDLDGKIGLDQTWYAPEALRWMVGAVKAMKVEIFALNREISAEQIEKNKAGGYDKTYPEARALMVKAFEQLPEKAVSSLPNIGAPVSGDVGTPVFIPVTSKITNASEINTDISAGVGLLSSIKQDKDSKKLELPTSQSSEG